MIIIRMTVVKGKVCGWAEQTGNANNRYLPVVCSFRRPAVKSALRLTLSAPAVLEGSSTWRKLFFWLWHQT